MPNSLGAPSAAVAAEIKAAAEYYQTYDPEAAGAKAYNFQEYKGFDVQQALRNLFGNKCAYCECDLGDGLEVEHFRPKGGVESEPKHFGYWWLAHNWANLLPSCPPCNQRRRQHLVTPTMTEEELLRLLSKPPRKSYGKANQFPIGGTRAFTDKDNLSAEDPHLIDPTSVDPDSHLEWSMAGVYSVLLARVTVGGVASPYGLASVDGYALNRPRLVQSRTRVLTELRFQRQEILEELAKESGDPAASATHIERALKRAAAMRRFHGQGQPYSAMAKAFVDTFIQELRQLVAELQQGQL